MTQKNQVVKETCYDDKGEPGWYGELEYNDNGDKTSDITYRLDGTIITWMKNMYDEHNQPILSVFYDPIEEAIVEWCVYENEYDNSNNLKKTTCYEIKGVVEDFNETLDCFKENSRMISRVEEYDNGMVSKYSSYREGCLVRVSELTYDSQGNQLKTKETYYHYEEGQLESISIDEYDSAGNTIKETHYDQNNKISSIHEYYANGNDKKETYYYEDGNVEFICEYDDDGNKIKWLSYYENGQLYIDEEYDSAGNTIGHVSYYENGNLEVKYEYDENHKLIKKTFYNEDGTIDFYIEYDKDGNRIN